MTIHFLLSHARLLNQLLSVFPFAGLTPEQLGQLAEISQEGRVLSSGLLELGRSSGSGNYPNTFQRAGQYRYVNNPDEESAARAAGWVVATFPETMIRFGAPDLVVHNAVEKDQALNRGYTLPGLPPSVVVVADE